MVSTTKNIDVTVTLDRDEEHINVPCIQTYRWKEKLAVLMLPRFQGSLQRTETLILKPGKGSYLNLSEHFTKASMLVTHWNSFKISRTLSGR